MGGSKEKEYGGENKAADNPNNLSTDANFGFDPNPDGRGMPRESPYTYKDVERSRATDGETAFDRDLQGNEWAQYKATETADSDGDKGDQRAVTSDFTPGSYLDLDTTTILEHQKMLSFENPEFIKAEATGWNTLSQQLFAAADKLHKDAQALSGTWVSDEAKEMFIGRVGASTYSLREWALLADDNYQANKVLHVAVRDGQQQMKALYRTFESWLADARTAELQMNDSDIVPINLWDKVPARIQTDYFNPTPSEAGYALNEAGKNGPVYAVIKRFSDESRAKPMNTVGKGFDDANQRVNSGTQVWRGMQNAKNADKTRFFKLFMKGPGTPNMPGRPGMPSLPGAPGMPSMPPMPGIPGMGAPPVVPNMQQLLQQPFNQQAMQQLRGLQDYAQQFAMQQSQLAALQAMMNAMQAKKLAEQFASQQAALEAKMAADAAAASQAQLAAAQAAAQQAQAAAAPAAAAAQPRVAQRGLQAALANVQANMPGAPGAPGMGEVNVPAFGMPGYSGAPGMGGMPSLPGMSAPAAPGGMGSPMGSPMAGRPGAGRPAMPNLPGRNAGGGAGPKSFATKVNLPGRGGSPTVTPPPGGGPAARPTIGGRATPTPKTPGSTATPGVPGRTMPRALGGRNTEAVRRFVAGRGPQGLQGLGAASGVGSQTGLAGRSLARPDKAENLERARSAMRRSLQGRTVMETEESRRVAARNAAALRAAKEHSPYLQRREEQASDSLAKIGLIDDHELFEVAGAGNGVIAKPNVSGPVKKAGPAIGTP